MAKYCPDCGSFLNHARKCSCGWLNVVNESIAHDGGCSYRLGDRRCPLPGTMSPYTTKSDVWYCTYHFFSRNDPKLAEADLKNAEDNHIAIMESQISWRTKFWRKLDEEAKIRKKKNRNRI